MASYGPGLPGTADAVVVGGGTIGAWCAYFLKKAGLERVVLVEKGVLGQAQEVGAPRADGATAHYDGVGGAGQLTSSGHVPMLGLD